MKKRNVVVIVLLIAMLLMGSAYALWEDTVAVTVTAESATMDLKIVGRTASSTGTITQQSSPTVIDAGVGVELVEESITNFIPNETLTYVYTIKNMGTIDVVFDKFAFATAANGAADVGNADLAGATTFTWATATDNNGAGQLMNAIAAETDIDDITLAPNATTTLTITMLIDDPSTTPYSSKKGVVYTITPHFTQAP